MKNKKEKIAKVILGILFWFVISSSISVGANLRLPISLLFYVLGAFFFWLWLKRKC